ncbi:MAG: hypothetical protein WA584_02760 [Pyrinomonadaceae bacterium]
MPNKVYLVALAVFLLVMFVLTYYSSSWLGSIGDPRSVVINYEYFSRISGNFLWISTFILLVLANVILWKTRKSWAFWTTLVYFCIFTVLYTFWLDKTFSQYLAQNTSAPSAFSLRPLYGALLCIGFAVFVFFNQFLVARLHDRMFPKPQMIEAVPEDSVENVEENSE